MYRAADARAGHDADAHVRLALWCEAQGLSSERIKQLTLAVLYNPSHALARGLLGLVSYDGKWQNPEQVSRWAREDPVHKARVREYLERRVKAPDRAEDQWKLALWCEQNGLKAEAAAHLYRVLQLDPSRDAAWKHLGFKRAGGRWEKPERIAAAKAEAQEQHKANNHWKVVLERLAAGLASKDKTRRAEAEAGLALVTNPRAVPMIWVTFAHGGPERQQLAVRLLGQVDSPGASRALAILAILGGAPVVRAHATETLRWRDPRDFAPLLVGMLRDPIKYEVRPVGGPGSSGEIVIKKPEVNVERRYSPPVPNVAFEANDFLTYDSDGLPVLIRSRDLVTPMQPVPGNSVAAAEAMFGFGAPPPAFYPTGPLAHPGIPPALTQKPDAHHAHGPRLQVTNQAPTPDQHLWAGLLMVQQAAIPIGRMMIEAEQVARAAQEQLAGDARAIDAYNAGVRDSNDFLRRVLAGAIGTDLGAERTAWQKWMVDLFGYAYGGTTDSRYEQPKPTVVENVPLDYQSQGVPIIVAPPQAVGVEIVRHSCFGAGTPVQTLEGLRPIEKLAPATRCSLKTRTQASSSTRRSWPCITTRRTRPFESSWRRKRSS